MTNLPQRFTTLYSSLKSATDFQTDTQLGPANRRQSSC